MKRILLDSHTFLWFVLRKPLLSRSADALISDPSNIVLVSPATFWEIAIKVGKNKLDLTSSYD
ncbi:MAG: type II toxin-antitoxin system VapC family toxin, partial [Planctomyces sp.]